MCSGARDGVRGRCTRCAIVRRERFGNLLRFAGVRGKCWVLRVLSDISKKSHNSIGAKTLPNRRRRTGCVALSHPASATPGSQKNTEPKRAPPMARRTRSHALTRRTLSRAALPLCMPILFGFTPGALPTSDCADAMERSQVAERAGDPKCATLALEQALPEYQNDYALTIRVAWLLLLQERQPRRDQARDVLCVLDTTDGLAPLATAISQCEQSARVTGLAGRCCQIL